MPLHLLQKKSWNPYNPVAIARVRADEEAAAAREEADEQRQQQRDAERRLAILRGVTPPPLENTSPPRDGQRSQNERREDNHSSNWRKKRRLNGEDDTDRDIRLAREDGIALSEKQILKATRPGKDDVVSLTDANGNIQLFEPPKQIKEEKNAEAEVEKKRKERELEDRYTMRFSNAAGFKEAVDAAPWYASRSNTDLDNGEDVTQRHALVRTNVWGREDTGRLGRDEARTASADPMAAMKKAQSQLKTVERERERWRTEKEREIEDLRRDGNSRREKRRHRHAPRNVYADGDLEGFNLDAPQTGHAKKSGFRHREETHGRHRRRSRSPTRRI